MNKKHICGLKVIDTIYSVVLDREEFSKISFESKFKDNIFELDFTGEILGKISILDLKEKNIDAILYQNEQNGEDLSSMHVLFVENVMSQEQLDRVAITGKIMSIQNEENIKRERL